MSAPVTDRSALRTPPRRSGAVRRAAVPTQRGAERRSDPVGSAAGRAYARRDERARRSTGTARPAAAEPTRRAQFVLLVMGLLTAGLVLTLGLSTAAAVDSYRLQAARERAAALTEQAEGLRRSVAIAGSPTELARRAEALGMVPVRDAARLVVAPDGSVEVVGEPTVVRAPAPVLPPAPAAPAPGAPAAASPGAAAPDGAAPDAVPGPATEDAAVAADGTPGAGAGGAAGADGAAAEGGAAGNGASEGAVEGAAPTDPAAGGPAAADPAADPAAAGAN